jgi:histidinol-phosphate aminotransferase
MQRRTFLRSSIAAGLMGAGGTALAPRLIEAEPRRHPEGPIRLNSNENPLGISPMARQAIIDGMVDANRYPRGRGEVIAALATKHGMPGETFVIGAGSTEVLKMAVQALAAPSGALVLGEPTYEDAPWYAGPFDIQQVKVPLMADGAHDLERMRQAANAATGAVLVYLCNPNNPTGTLTPSADIDAWIESAPENMYFLVDEAYYDYVRDTRYWSALKWVPDRPNVIVARTFSKVYGMAGIRLGYAITHPETAQRVRRMRVRNNANHFATVAGLASLRDPDFVRRSLDVNERGKAILYACLDELGLAYVPSHTNFVMHRISGELQVYRQRMREMGIWVGRPFPPMLDHCRLSIGTPDEMETFAAVLRSFRQEGWV